MVKVAKEREPLFEIIPADNANEVADKIDETKASTFLR